MQYVQFIAMFHDSATNKVLQLAGDFEPTIVGIYVFKVNNRNIRAVLNMFKFNNKDTK